MKTAKILTPVEWHERSTDGFVYFKFASSMSNRSPVQPWHSRFFKCVDNLDCTNRQYVYYGDSQLPILSGYKNVFNITSVFEHRCGLVVSSAVRKILEGCCDVKFCELSISQAFFYPYMPGIDLDNLIEDPHDWESTYRRIAACYKCNIPDDVFSVAIAPSAYLFKSNYLDSVEAKVAHGVPEEMGVYERSVNVSREMIERHGIVLDCGYLCRPDVFSKLNPYLVRPYYWAQMYAYF